MTTKPLFEIGQKVNYLPTLTGLDKRNEITISERHFKESDSIYESLGVKFEPTWIYLFEEISLSSEEKDLKQKQTTMNTKQEWIIYGKGYDKKVEWTTRKCIKPDRTKEYKEFEKRFDTLESDLQSFGYVSKEKLKEEGGWIGINLAQLY